MILLITYIKTYSFYINNMDATETNKEIKKLGDIEITDENVALNVLVSYCNLAQQRGAFNIEESAKIWECIKMFRKE